MDLLMVAPKAKMMARKMVENLDWMKVLKMVKKREWMLDLQKDLMKDLMMVSKIMMGLS